MHKITIGGLSDQDRITTLEWLLDESFLAVNTSLEILVRRMHGFRFGDINAVISIATR